MRLAMNLKESNSLPPLKHTETVICHPVCFKTYTIIRIYLYFPLFLALAIVCQLGPVFPEPVLLSHGTWTALRLFPLFFGSPRSFSHAIGRTSEIILYVLNITIISYDLNEDISPPSAKIKHTETHSVCFRILLLLE